jgi:hypothetical protein
MRPMTPKPGTDPGTTAPRRFRWKLFGIGLAAIVLGYVLLAVNNITIAPVLLVLGYCVLVPLSFL